MTSRPLRAVEDLDEAELTSLACLVSLRVKGQQVFNEEHVSLEKGEVEDAILEADTEHPANIAKSSGDDLKRRFLDRLAELVSHRKGGPHVASTALVENGDSVSVYVAKNDGFSPAERQGLNTMFHAMSQFVFGRCSKDSSHILLTSLLEYYKERLDHHYIPKLQKDLENSRHKFPMSAIFSEEQVKTQNIDHCRESKIAEDWHSKTKTLRLMLWERSSLFARASTIQQSERRLLLTSKAYDIRHSSSFRTYIHTYLGDSATEELLCDIFFLGRIRAAYETFRMCFRKILSFAQMDGYLILPPKITPGSAGSQFTLAQVLQLAGLGCDLPTIQKHINQKMQRKQLEERFGHLQQHTLMNLRVHAEVQVLVAVQQVTEDLQDFFPYLGCSKLSCFLCSRLVRAYGFATRGCHGRLYERWTVSNDSGFLVQPAKQPRLVSALKTVFDELIQIIRTPLSRTMPRIAESSAGCTVDSNASGCSKHLDLEHVRHQIRQFDNHAKGLKHALLRVVGDHVAQDRSSDTTVSQVPKSTAHLRSESRTSSRDPGTGNCKACLKLTRQTCDLCHNEWICSRKCEQEIRINHIFRCSPNRPLDSADYLVKACYDGMFPDDPQTRNDFGFSKLYTTMEHNRLFFLYNCLIHSVNWDSRMIHTWQLENHLASKIRLLCLIESSDPIVSTSFSWFLDDQHVVDTSTPALGETEVVMNGFQRAWRHIGLEDGSDQTVLENVADWPALKRSAFTLYSTTLRGLSPGPQSREWMTFGFCACPNQGSRFYLVFLYRLLIDKCTFEEFCIAVGSFKLFRLLCEYIFEMKTPKRVPSVSEIEILEHTSCDRRPYDPECLNNAIPHLQNVLQGHSITQHSVWLLKKFVLSNECYPINFVVMHYGFFNCQNATERLELKTAYKELLADDSRGDPIELQSACLANDIYEYASRKIAIDDKFKRLMRNLNKDGQAQYVFVRLTRKSTEKDEELR